MTARQSLDKLLESLPEERVREVVDFAQFLSWQVERSNWREFGQSQLARAYGPNEPEDTAADIKHFRDRLASHLKP
jgi:hypothetical protein